MPRYLTPSNTYDRATILRSAWTTARDTAKRYAKQGATVRGEFKDALRRAWSLAKAERSYALWCIEQDRNAAAETARRAALPVRDRQIEDARTDLLMAEMNDTHGSHRLVAAAHARLASLQHAA
jgi:hypothetical protein